MSAMKARFQIAECSQPSPWEKGLGERGGALFNGKEGRGDFRKKSLIKGKGGLVGFRKNPSLWQKKDGSSFEKILMAKEGRG